MREANFFDREIVKKKFHDSVKTALSAPVQLSVSGVTNEYSVTKFPVVALYSIIIITAFRKRSC